MSLWKLYPEDGTMRRIAREIAIQTSVRRACLLARQFTGLEVMPEEMACSCVETMSILGRIWDNEDLSRRKPDSTVNFASCMAVMEWAHSVKKQPTKTYTLDSKKISDQLDFVATTMDDLFPGIMSAKNATQCIYDGVCATADGCEKNGWQWTKKLNEQMVCLMALYPILRAFGKVSIKMDEICKEFLDKKNRKGSEENGD